MATHSEKALATLRAMNAEHATWHYPKIKWVEETHDMPHPDYCGECVRPRSAWDKTKAFRLADGSLLDPKKAAKYGPNSPVSERDVLDWAVKNQAEVTAIFCPTCGGTGKVKVMRPTKVMVGYPDWPKLTIFDSPYAGRGCACQLCNKTVLKSRLVPFQAKDAKGRWHGIWVGADCARKFLAVKVPTLKDDEFLAPAFQ